MGNKLQKGTPAWQSVSIASHRDVIGKPVRLKHGNDAKVAAELDAFISEANDGLRRILKVGFFIECIDADLPWGMLQKWVEQHLPHRKFRTIQRWKQVAQNVGECVGLKLKDRLGLKLHEVITLTLDELTGDAKAARNKIEDEIEGKTYRQLFLQFKQSKDGETPTNGRRKGEGGATREQRAQAKRIEAETEIAGLEIQVRQFGNMGDALANDKAIGNPIIHATFDEVFPQIENVFRYMQRIQAARKGPK